MVTPPPRNSATEVFTARFGDWWPLVTHSVGTDKAATVALGIGGIILETLADGTTTVWGTITRWEPPARVAFSWHAGTPEAEAGLVEVVFTPSGAGSTLVELTHSGWENRPDGAGARAEYEPGWDL